jgi:hypothetical protein
MIEFSSLLTAGAHEESFPMRVIHPQTGKESDFTIFLLGPDSKAVRKATREAYKRLSESKADEYTNDDLNLHVALAAVTGWQGLAEGGQEYQFSKDRAESLFMASPFILDQVTVFLRDRENFIRG